MKPLAYVMLARAFFAFGCVVLVFGVAAYAYSAGFGSIVPAVVALVAAVILYVTSFGWYFGFVRAINRAFAPASQASPYCLCGARSTQGVGQPVTRRPTVGSPSVSRLRFRRRPRAR